MAHSIPVWRQLGTVVSEAQTSAAAIQLAGLDWTVEKWPLQSHGQDQQGKARIINVPNRLATVRTDTAAVLGIVSADYQVFQNVKAFDFMDALVDERLATYETAGVLKSGRRVWILARIPKELRIGRTSDVVEPYVLLANAHDGTMALRMVPTTLRLVCGNTLNLALSRAGSMGVSIRHLETLESRVNDARGHLSVILKHLDEFQEQMNALAKVNLKETQVKNYFHEVFDLPKNPDLLLDWILERQAQRSQLMDELLIDYNEQTERQQAANTHLLDQLMENFQDPSNTLPSSAGTAWAACNSVSQYVDHQGRSTSSDNRLNSIWFGDGNQVKQKAFAVALQLAHAV